MAATANAPQVADNKLWLGGIEPFRASYGKVMMWFFLISDTFTFSALLVAYGLVRFSFPAYQGTAENFVSSNTYWPIPERIFDAAPFLHGVHAPLVFVGFMTFVLIFSSVTMVLAVEAGHRMDRENVEKYMLWTLLGGVVFLGSQAWEWTHFINGTEGGTVMKDIIDGEWVSQTIVGANLVKNQYGPSAFADFFFFITGFHGTHVFSGVVLNYLIFYRSSTGFYDRRGSYEMVEKVGLYWHFVDLVWVFVFTFFYLV